MERGKFQQMVKEFPFLEKIHKVIVEGRIIEPKFVPKETDIRIARVDESFLMRILISDPPPSDTLEESATYEWLWAVSKEGKISKISLPEGPGVTGGTLRSVPIIEGLLSYEIAKFFVLVSEEFIGHLHTRVERITIYKPPKRFNLKKKVRDYHGLPQAREQLKIASKIQKARELLQSANKVRIPRGIALKFLQEKVLKSIPDNLHKLLVNRAAKVVLIIDNYRSWDCGAGEDRDFYVIIQASRKWYVFHTRTWGDNRQSGENISLAQKSFDELVELVMKNTCPHVEHLSRFSHNPELVLSEQLLLAN